MSKFGLVEDDAVDTYIPPVSRSDRLAAFPVVRPRAPLDLFAPDVSSSGPLTG
jgi:hypothetical protein